MIQSPRKAASERGHTLFFLSELGVGAWGPHTSVDSSTQRPDLASPLPAGVPVDDSTAPVGKHRGGFAPAVARSETSHQLAHLSSLDEAPVSSRPCLGTAVSRLACFVFACVAGHAVRAISPVELGRIARHRWSLVCLPLRSRQERLLLNC